MDPRLLITNIGLGISIFVTVIFSLFVFIKGPKKSVNVTFFILNILVVIFEAAHVYGINEIDREVSKNIFLWTLAVIPIAAFNVHCTYAFLGISRKLWQIVSFIYVSGTALIIYYLFNPSRFLEFSAPKLYFPNYYEPADHHKLVLYFLAITVFLLVYRLVIAYKTASEIEKNRLKYVIAGIVVAYGFGSSPYFLAYDIPIDPIIIVFMGLYIFPFSYAILKYDLLSITIIAKRAFLYAVAVVIVSTIVGLVGILYSYLEVVAPDYPRWIIPVLIGLIAVALGAFVWEKIKEVDTLKYEFITVITHKFRTPLTYIKWSIEELQNPKKTAEEKVKAIERINAANYKLVELTDILVGLSKVEGVNYLYSFVKKNFTQFIREVVDQYRERALEKNISLSVVSDPNLGEVDVDVSRMQFALQIIIENALNYTPNGGLITLKIIQEGSHLILGIRDTGIGIKKEDLPFIFTKFFRSARARSVDTEGMGVGLFMVRYIIERHKGSVWVMSEGEGKGSTFFIKLPVAK